ncbi:hypothetical protein V5P93_005261 [Actinokineospora auranticolor]|uniref:DUF7933 domain-containing protein n=1 Tax=Actinokineospora auranticolor TaxID=155976 RepID=A0A2S6GCY8_9PSEU|nr:hypothetical protein [Actinokineospora auranticolor]PPK63117.1 hypothetical protein CLV40_13250 [Actinokineospora auranticolor]
MRTTPALRAAVLSAVLVAGAVTTAEPAVAAVNPTMSAAYSVSASAVNTRRSIVFTITNTNPQNTRFYDWSWSLPSGLSLALNQVPLSWTCLSMTADDEPIESGRTALPTETIYVEGNTVIGEASCTLTVPITSSVEGFYSTCGPDITGLTALTFTACGFIRYEDRHPHRAATPR